MQLRQAIGMGYPESWWQSFLQDHLPRILQGYTGCFSKVNISAGMMKFPDFLLPATTGYLDVLEIKRPSMPLLKKDRRRGMPYWSKECSAAISQLQHYLSIIQEHSLRISEYVLSEYQQEVRIVSPKGILLAGDTSQFSSRYERDSFRLLAQSVSNIRFITYDELLSFLYPIS